MIIDCHGHYTSEPPAFTDFRKRKSQRSAILGSARAAAYQRRSDSRKARTRATEISARARHGRHDFFAPRLRHGPSRRRRESQHGLDANLQRHDPSRLNLYPKKFIGVCQLPQSPGVPPENCIPELERCVNELGFVGCNLNPDPSGGYWKEQPLTDQWWYPIYEKMVELEVPAMVHVTGTCNPAFHTTGSHYINGDTTAFMQFLTSDLFKDFPTLKFIIPHGGGAVPYHWGRIAGSRRI